MPKPKKKDKEFSIDGYIRTPIYREFVYIDYPGLPEGTTPLTVKVQQNLSFAQTDAIPTAPGTSYETAFRAIAPFVSEWNVLRLAIETGEMESVPPPIEVGWEVLQLLDHLEANWLLERVKFGHLVAREEAQEVAERMREVIAETRKKGLTPSENTPGPSSDGDSE